MSDERLRELERRWKETGSVEDEAAFLLERVRAGELTQERLELAAYCGLQGAAKAAPSVLAVGDIRSWLSGLESRGAEARVRATIALARLALVEWERLRSQDQRPRLAVEAAERWAMCPCQPCLESARDAGVAATEAARSLPMDNEHLAARAAAHLAEAATLAPEWESAGIQDVLHARPEPVIRGAILDDLVPWLLGSADPLASR